MGAGSLHVLSTLAVMGPLRDVLAPSFEREAGLVLDITFDPTNVLLEQIRGGARADVVIATDTALSNLVVQDVVQAGSVATIASTAVGLAKREGTPPVDISTPEAFLATLRAARSLVYSRTGASGVFFADLIERLGIAEDIRDKAIVVPKGFTAETMVRGDAEFAVQQISELKVVSGAEIIGAFPAPHASRTRFSAGVFRGSLAPHAARAFISSLCDAAARPIFTEAGLTPAGAPAQADD